MKFTQVMALINMDELPALARGAEAVGFEALALGEHFVTFKQQYEVYDYSKDGMVLWYPCIASSAVLPNPTWSSMISGAVEA